MDFRTRVIQDNLINKLYGDPIQANDGFDEFLARYDKSATYGQQPVEDDSWIKKMWGPGGQSWGMNALYAGLEAVSGNFIDWDKSHRMWNADEYAKEFNITPDEKEAYINTGVLPDRIVQAQDLQKRQEEAAIAFAGGKLDMTVDFIQNNPGEVIKMLGEGIVADPWLLGLPSVYAGAVKAVARAGKVSTKAAAAGVAAETAVGAGLGAGGEAARSYMATGEVDPEAVKGGAMMVGGVGGVIGISQALFGALRRGANLVEKSVGVNGDQVVVEIMKYAEAKHIPMAQAMAEVLEKYKVDATPVISEVEAATARFLDDIGAPPGASQSLKKSLPGTEKSPRPVETPPQGPQTTNYPASGGGVQTQRIAAATSGKPVAPAPVTREKGYGLVEERGPDISPWTKEGHEPGSRVAQDMSNDMALARDIRRIAWKERSAAFGEAQRQGTNPATELFETSAFRPNDASLQGPVLTMQEFMDTAMARGANGKRLSGAALQARYNKFHRDLQKSSKDPSQNVTLRELEEIMSENSTKMRNFFIEAGRKTGTRRTQIPGKFVDPARKQSGNIDPKLLGILGGSGMAALISYGANHDPLDAVLWALGVGGSLTFGGYLMRRIMKLHPFGKDILANKRSMHVDEVINKFNGDGAKKEHEILQIYNTMKVISGEKDLHSVMKNKEARNLRERVTLALEDKTKTLYNALPEHGKELYKLARQIWDDEGQKALADGVIHDVIENYVTHAWNHPFNSTQAFLEKMFGKETKRKAMDTVHKETRIIPSYALGKSKGLTPRTLDVAELITMYLKSIDQARRSQIVFDTFKKTKHPLDNIPILQNYKNAPVHYKIINHPKFTGWKVHPDVAAAIDAMWGSRDPSALMRGLYGLNFLFKRQEVSLSGFHAKALMFSALMAAGPKGILRGLAQPIKSTKEFMQLFNGKSPVLQEFLSGKIDSPINKAIDEGLSNGLVLNMVDDVGKDTFYGLIDDITAFTDNAYQKVATTLGNGLVGKTAGSPFKVIGGISTTLKHLNKFTDAVMWDRIYTTLKLMTYLREMETLGSKFGNKIPRAQLSAQAAEFTNDAFGGINWNRIAQNVEGRVASNLAHQMVSPTGRQGMQMLMFAPDWTISQIRMFTKAWANKNPVQQALYQRYQFTGLLMMQIAGDALNYALTGHHIWENKDPASIELGDGRRFVLSKQYWEPAKWVWHPQQSAMNKLSTAIRTGLELGTGSKYIRYGKPSPPIESIPGHIFGKALPISGHAWMEHGFGAGLSSAAGFPIYGKKAGNKPFDMASPEFAKMNFDNPKFK